MIHGILFRFLTWFRDLFVTCCFELIISNFLTFIRNGFCSIHNHCWHGRYHTVDQRSNEVELNIYFSSKNWICGSSEVTFRDGVTLNYLVTAKKQDNYFDFTYYSFSNRPSFTMELTYFEDEAMLTGTLNKTTCSGKNYSYPVDFTART